MRPNSSWHATTILTVRKGGRVVIAGDGQVSLGQTIIKSNARKVRRLGRGDVIGGFAGATADAFTLFERLEGKLEQYPGQLTRAAVELAKDWRTDRFLRRLEAMMLVADASTTLVLTGTGDVLEPENYLMGIGSGGNYALAAARALLDQPLDAEAIARKAMAIAAEICVYTNTNIVVETLDIVGIATMSIQPYTFRRVTVADLPLLKSWLEKPHVREWWGDPVRALATIHEHIGNSAVDLFIVAYNGKPLGYIQSWNPHAELRPLPAVISLLAHAASTSSSANPISSTAAMAEPSSALLSNDCLSPERLAVVTDPNPRNARAIQAYAKARISADRPPYDDLRRGSVDGPRCKDSMHMTSGLTPDDLKSAVEAGVIDAAQAEKLSAMRRHVRRPARRRTRRSPMKNASAS